MTGQTLLVPIRVPLTDAGRHTVRHAIEHATSLGGAHLYVLHVNVVHDGDRVSRADLQRSVEAEFGPLEDASYHVRQSFLLEEAILDEAIQQDVDAVIIGRSRRRRLRRILEHRLDLSVDLESFLGQHLEADLVVV